MPRVFITAAEPSGEQHAAKLVRELWAIRPDLEIRGLGGPAMRRAGVELQADTVSRAAMGWRALLRAREVRALLRRTDELFDHWQPDLQICVDSWTMNNHFATLAKRRGAKVLYYVAPQTWASRESRVVKMRRCIDKLACILPFEQDYFRDRGLDATFVGHPLFDELPADRSVDRAGRFPQSPPVVAWPAGSRTSVARANFPRQLAVARRIAAEVPGARFLVPTTQNTHDVVGSILARSGMRGVEPRRDAFDPIMRESDLCLTVSGTAALHVAAWGVPMMVVYATSRLLWHGFARWVVRTRTYSLVNLLDPAPLEGQQLAPEFIPWFGPTEPLAWEAIKWLRDPAELERRRARLLRMIRTIDQPGASRRAAELAAQMLQPGGT